jgi:hypothetical protein
MAEPSENPGLSQELAQIAAALKAVRAQIDQGQTGQAIDRLDDLIARLDAVPAAIASLESGSGVLASLGEWLGRVFQTEDRSRVETIVLDLLLSLAGGERGLLMLKDGSGDLIARAMHNLDISAAQDINFNVIRRVAERAATTGETIVTSSVDEDPRLSAGDSVIGFDVKSIAVLPLKSGGQVTGVAYFDRPVREGAFTPQILRSLEAFSGQIADLLEGDIDREASEGEGKKSAAPVPEQPYEAVDAPPPPASVPPPAPPPPPAPKPEWPENAPPAREEAPQALDRLDNNDDSEAETTRWEPQPTEPPTRRLPNIPIPEPPRRAGTLPDLDEVLAQPGEPQAAGIDDLPAPQYADLKARLYSLVVQEVGANASAEKVADVLTVILAEQAIVMSRAERSRLLGSILTEMRGASEVRFSAYYPSDVQPEEWQSMYAYVLREAVTKAVEEDAAQQLGERLADYRQVARPASHPVSEGAMITATPLLPGFQFNPPSIQMGFYEDWHRFDFKLRAKDAPLDQAANGVLTFSVEGVIVADVPLSIFVSQQPRPRKMISAAQKAYNAVFCSYSHKDTLIVERVERAIKTLGVEYLRDVHALRSGQHWGEELYKLIDRADIFQLFWSPTAAQSPYVEQEWRYALDLDRGDTFIRPVYWQRPIPSVPQELRHIHFAYQSDLAE